MALETARLSYIDVPSDTVADSKPLTTSNDRHSTLLLKIIIFISCLILVVLSAMLYMAVGAKQELDAVKASMEAPMRSAVRLVNFMNNLTDSATALFGGSLPVLLDQVASWNFTSVANSVNTFSDKVFSATCGSSDSYVSSISQISSLVKSITQKVAAVGSPSSTVMAAVGSSECGLALNVFNYLQNYVTAQMDSTQWKTLATACLDLNARVQSAAWSGTYSSSGLCGTGTGSWDWSNTMTSITNEVANICTALNRI